MELTKEKKKELKELFDEYVNLDTQSRTLTADSRDALNDFATQNFEDMEPDTFKSARKELSKYMKSKHEYTEGAEPVKEVVVVREEHLPLNNDPDAKEYLKALYIQRDEDLALKETLKEKKKEIITKVRFLLDTSEDIAKGMFNEFLKIRKGNISIINEVAGFVTSFKEVVFTEENS